MPDEQRYTVRRLDPATVQVIRELATRHRVSAAEVISEAVCEFEHELKSGRIGYPEGWRIPRKA